MKSLERTIVHSGVGTVRASKLRGLAQRVRLSLLLAIMPSVVTATPVAAEKKDAIRAFRANVPDADLSDLKRRLAATRWPELETVTDLSQGPQLAKLQQLVRYWGTSYDWKKAEGKLNSFPQFVTEIDGLDIHFIHVRSKHPNALPVIIAHGWPGSLFEQIKLIGPLTDPTNTTASRRA